MSHDRPRVPNFKRFLITGAVLGLLVGIAFGLRDPGGPSYIDPVQVSGTSATAFVGLFGAFIGTGLAGLLAVLLDRTGKDGGQGK